jgi:hypothetical protein
VAAGDAGTNDERSEMNPKEKTQLCIVLLVTGVYLILVLLDKAAVEGFAMMAMYIIKKFLDIVEKENGGQPK